MNRASVPEVAVTGVTLSIHTDDAERTRAAYGALLGATGDPPWAVADAVVTATDGRTGVFFETGDPVAAERLLVRRGLPGWTGDDVVASGRRSQRYPLLGIRGPAAVGQDVDEGSVEAAANAPVAAGIDHVVLSAPDADTAIVLFAGQLGLDFRLIRPLTATVTQLFFRMGGLVVEVVVDGDAPAGADPEIGLLGVAWRVGDADTARAALVAAGVEVSEVRRGRKPGTRVATVRERAFGTPTLIIEQKPRAEPSNPVVAG